LKYSLGKRERQRKGKKQPTSGEPMGTNYKNQGKEQKKVLIPTNSRDLFVGTII